MKLYRILAATAVLLLAGTVCNAQFGNLRDLANKAKSTVGSLSSQSQNAASQASSAASSASSTPAAAGKTYYVSVTTGSGRADGLSPEKPMKDLQKAIDAAEDNDVILVAEGNYLGNLDRGYLQSGKFADATHDPGKFISIYGGYSTDFSERDVIKHITKIQPREQKFTAPLFNVNARRP